MSQTKVLTCRECEKSFSVPVPKRGRPPSYCFRKAPKAKRQAAQAGDLFDPTLSSRKQARPRKRRD